jgi:hypothetical protein
MDAKSVVAAEIEQSANQFIEIFSLLPTERLNTVFAAGSWTAGQLGEHVVKSTAGIPDAKIKVPERAPDQQIGLIKSVFLNFEMKYRSPEFIIPGNGPFDKQQLLTELNGNKQRNIKTAETTDLTALCIDFELPHFGYLTRYEWLKLIIYHTQRHSKQLKEITEKLRSVHA